MDRPKPMKGKPLNVRLSQSSTPSHGDGKGRKEKGKPHMHEESIVSIPNVSWLKLGSISR